MFSFPSIQELAVRIPVFLLALTIHEVAHGWVADRLGDRTARLQGRLTLNPLAHLDPIGTLAIVLIGFGWAKPVPVDYRYLQNPRRDMMMIAAAGPASNLILAVAITGCLRLFPWQSAVAAAEWLVIPVLLMLRAGVWVNVVLAVFNLVPIPPLDGSRLVSGLLPLRQALVYNRLEPFGFLIIFALFFSGIMDPIFGRVIRTITLALFGMWG
jgi:Zn-dependent protease